MNLSKTEKKSREKVAKSYQTPLRLKKGQRFTKRTVAKALRANGGFISFTARALQCHEDTVRNYLKRFPELQVLREEAREGQIDMAEASLISQVRKENTIATLFTLKCLAKDRGYIDAPQQHLHAHAEIGGGTWVDIVKRVASAQAKATGGTAETIALPLPKKDDIDVIEGEVVDAVPRQKKKKKARRARMVYA